MTVKRLAAVLIALCLGCTVGACSPMSSFASDHWPHWAGGLPQGAPPRPGAPGYDEYIAHQQASTAPAKPATAASPPVAQAASAAPAAESPADDAAAVAGGLY
jgi:hypothetical protein